MEATTASTTGAIADKAKFLNTKGFVMGLLGGKSSRPQ
jgi:hypothetical protein